MTVVFVAPVIVTTSFITPGFTSGDHIPAPWTAYCSLEREIGMDNPSSSPCWSRSTFKNSLSLVEQGIRYYLRECCSHPFVYLTCRIDLTCPGTAVSELSLGIQDRSGLSLFSFEPISPAIKGLTTFTGAFGSSLSCSGYPRKRGNRTLGKLPSVLP